MKKLWTVLSVAALGIGTFAQAQIAVTPTARFDREEVRLMKADMPSQRTVDMPQFTQTGVKYDTLYWHDEYTNEDCGGGWYYLKWGSSEGYFEDEIAFSGVGHNMCGTGEIGVTVTTSGGVYRQFIGDPLTDYLVVGAVGVGYRQGSGIGWERAGLPSGELYDGHVTEVGGIEYPDMPYRMKGYPYVKTQQTVGDYYDLLDGKEATVINVNMPLTMEDMSVSDVDYLAFSEPRENQGTLTPGMRWIGGLFDKPMYAGTDYGLAIEAQITGDARYDSLWNWALGVKSGSHCMFVDEWAAWDRIDYSNLNGWVWLHNNDGSPIIASDPMEEGGLALEGNEQYGTGNSLFCYLFSQGLQTGDSKFLPAIYSIIQRAAANEPERDAYAQTISVYPTPATDKVNMVSVDAMQRIELYNMAGSLLKHVTLNSNIAEMDVTDMAPGTYVVRIATEKGVASKKLVVR